MNRIYKILGLLILLIATQVTVARSAWLPDNPIQVDAKLSQTKLVQHGTDTVFVDMTLIPPEVNRYHHLEQRATDIIIVLDRSGSMSEAKKMPYAKAAIWDVLGRLHNNDRFALVTFANNAIVQSPLVNVTSTTRSYLNNVVTSIRPSGGTNMGEGLNTALSLLENNPMGRARKILLLSDGQANQGITNPQLLAQMASRATHHGAVLSTIGMGLGFNETLMAKLSDYGMGHYSYLEDLSGLGSILARDLQDTRNIYANSSTLHIQLGDGVQLVDAGGYPVSRIDPSTMSVSTGQMLANTQKHFVMTFKVPTNNLGTVSIGDMQLNYQSQGQQISKKINQQSFDIAVVAPELRYQAQQSIDRNVYQNSWLENNLGIMQKKLSKWMREGKKDKAKQEIVEYRKQMQAAEATSNISLASPVVEGKLKEMEDQVGQAFSGSLLDQQVKRNRAAKSMQYDSIKTQRK